MNVEQALEAALAMPHVKQRLMRACVVTVRDLGFKMADFQPYGFELRGDSLAMTGRGVEIVRLPLSDLAGRVN